MKLVLTAKYLPATNTRGSRVKITWPAYGKSIARDWNHALNGADHQALAALSPLALRWGIGGAGKYGYFLTTDWPSMDEAKRDAIREFFGVK